VETHPKAAAHRATPHSGVGKHAVEPDALPAFNPTLTPRKAKLPQDDGAR